MPLDSKTHLRISLFKLQIPPLHLHLLGPISAWKLRNFLVQNNRKKTDVGKLGVNAEGDTRYVFACNCKVSEPLRVRCRSC